MNDLNSIPNETVCDLVDGRLPEDACEQALTALLSDARGRQTWYAYHVVGDVLRSAELAPSPSDHAFLERLERRLANEPVRPPAVELVVPLMRVSASSANASVFRWKMLAGVACAGLIGSVGLSLWTPTNQGAGMQMAGRGGGAAPAMPIVVTADTGAGPMLRDARLDELMAAHRQLGGHSALQVPAGFLRNATYEGPAR